MPLCVDSTGTPWITTNTISTSAGNHLWWNVPSATASSSSPYTYITTTNTVERTLWIDEQTSWTQLTRQQDLALAHQRQWMRAQQMGDITNYPIRAAPAAPAAPAIRRPPPSDEPRQPSAAHLRARDLLLDNLTEAQRATFLAHGWFIVLGGKTGKKYRVRNDRTLVGNVDVFADEDTVSHSLCCHLADLMCPVPDHLLAQKVFLEVDEERFVRTANRFPPRYTA